MKEDKVLAGYLPNWNKVEIGEYGYGCKRNFEPCGSHAAATDGHMGGDQTDL